MSATALKLRDDDLPDVIVDSANPAPSDEPDQDHHHDFEFKPAIPRDVKDMGVLLTLWVLARPLVHLASFGLCVNAHSHSWCLNSLLHWIVAPVLGGMVFQRAFTNSHNLVHGSYPLPRFMRRTIRDALMFFYGLMFGYASHLFKETHYVHHHPSNRCGVNDDPESVCHRPALQVMAFGPYFTARIFVYGFIHARVRLDRVLGVMELVGVFTLAGMAAWTLHGYFHGQELTFMQKTLSFYAAEAALLLWLFPMNAAWLPHQRCYPTMLGQARNSPDHGGAVIAHLFFNLLVGGTRWHLLHHAYQYIPSCKLEHLASVPAVEEWMGRQFEDEIHHIHRHHH